MASFVMRGLVSRPTSVPVPHASVPHKRPRLPRPSASAKPTSATCARGSRPNSCAGSHGEPLRGSRYGDSVRRMPDRQPRKPVRTGELWPIDNAWRASVRDELATAGVSIRELARRLQCGRSTLHELFSVEAKHTRSRLVPAIHALLGRPPPVRRPVATPPDTLLRSVTAMWALLGTGDRELVVALVITLVGRSPEPTPR